MSGIFLVMDGYTTHPFRVIDFSPPAGQDAPFINFSSSSP